MGARLLYPMGGGVLAYVKQVNDATIEIDCTETRDLRLHAREGDEHDGRHRVPYDVQARRDDALVAPYTSSNDERTRRLHVQCYGAVPPPPSPDGHQPMDAGVWCPLNKIYIGNSTIAAPPPDFGGAFGVHLHDNQYPSWGEKIYPFDPRPYTEFIEVQIEPVYIVKVLLASAAARRDPITSHTPHPTPRPPRLQVLLGQPRGVRCIVSVKIWNDANGGRGCRCGGPRRRAGGRTDVTRVLQPEPDDLPPPLQVEQGADRDRLRHDLRLELHRLRPGTIGTHGHRAPAGHRAPHTLPQPAPPSTGLRHVRAPARGAADGRAPAQIRP